MKKTLKLIAIMLSLVLALSFTACGGAGGAATEEPAADDGQNPIMNFIGNYANGRATIFISATDSENGASAVVNWSSSAFEYSSWVMSGTFDSETLQFEYHDCVKTDYVFEDGKEEPAATEVYTGGHGFMTFKDGDPLTLTWQDDQENIADDAVFEYIGAVPVNGEDNGESGDASASMANPWKSADSLEAAAKGAGLEFFTFVDGMELSIGPVNADSYRYMDGLAEMHAPVGAVDLTIRKGTSANAADGDISGDYNEYAHEWTQNIKGLVVNCYGNREGEATKIIWSVDDMCFAILAYGAGGDDDFGLSPDDINSLINGLQ